MGNILLADAHVLTRVGLSTYINDLWGNCKIWETGDFDQALTLIRKGGIDFLVVDPDMPGGNGLKAINNLRISSPMLRILVLSRHSGDFHKMGLYYMKNGADGYITMDAKGADFRQALKLVGEGKRYYSDEISRLLVADYSGKDKEVTNPLDKLSAREGEVFRYMIEEKSVKYISKRLSLQISTISTYKKRVFDKLNVPSLVALVKVYGVSKKENAALKKV